MVHVKLVAALLAAVCGALPVLAAPAARPTDAEFLLPPPDKREPRPTDARFLATSAREYCRNLVPFLLDNISAAPARRARPTDAEFLETIGCECASRICTSSGLMLLCIAHAALARRVRPTDAAFLTPTCVLLAVVRLWSA